METAGSPTVPYCGLREELIPCMRRSRRDSAQSPDRSCVPFQRASLPPHSHLNPSSPLLKDMEGRDWRGHLGEGQRRLVARVRPVFIHRGANTEQRICVLAYTTSPPSVHQSPGL